MPIRSPRSSAPDRLVRIFSCSLSFGSRQLVCMQVEPTLGSSSYRKQTVPNCSGLSRQRIFNAFIQSAYFVGVEPFLVHLKKGPPERVSRDLLNCVADCLGRCGKSLVRHGSYHPRLVPAGEQLRGGAIVKTGHFTFQSACLAARQHIEGSDRTRFTRTKKRGCACIRSHQLDLVVVSNDGALRHQPPLRLAYGGAGGLSQGETGDFLSIVTIYSAATGAPNAHAPIRTKNQTSCDNRHQTSDQNADGSIRGH